MGRGGKRTGAGRPKGSGKYGEQTKAVRLPISKIAIVPDLLNHLPTNPAPESRIKTIENTTVVNGIFAPDGTTKYKIPLFMNPVSAGLPSITEDYVEGKIDLNHYLIKHPSATFLVRVMGDSMIDAGIHPNDLLIVDRAIAPTNGKVVIAVVNGELTVKRIRLDNQKLFLMPDNINYQPLQIQAEMDFQVWGVVTNVIHRL